MKHKAPLWFQRSLVAVLTPYHLLMNQVERKLPIQSRKAKREKALSRMWNKRAPWF